MLLRPKCHTALNEIKNVTKPKDEKTKWKESLMMFTSTLNLLISMGENALKNDDEKTEKPNDVES